LDNLHPDILEAIRRALVEDIGGGDATSNSIIPPEARMSGQIIAKQDGVIAGLDVAEAVCRAVDAGIRSAPWPGKATGSKTVKSSPRWTARPAAC
jgi:nicotinate-nucleotide pyrophosphorylase